MDENQIYYLGRVEKNTIVLKQNSESLLNIDISVKNWDDVLSAGIYSGINAKNSPENTSDTWINAICLCSNGNKNFLCLLALANPGKIFYRYSFGSEWHEWVIIK